MSRTFAYVRVSTFEQETQNHVMEIAAAGFSVAPHRIITETMG
jgi:putative DNA-invertase from lambdoid prophage Rac